MNRHAAILLCATLTGCSESGGACDTVEMIGVPASWDATEVHTIRIQWHVVPPENLPIECGDGEAPGCAIYGDDWTKQGDGWIAIGAADPRNWSETSEMGLRRYRTLAHEVMHHPFGSWHD